MKLTGADQGLTSGSGRTLPASASASATAPTPAAASNQPTAAGAATDTFASGFDTPAINAAVTAFEDWIRSFMQTNAVPGATFTFFGRGGVIRQTNLGVAQRAEGGGEAQPVTGAHLFGIASQSKLFTQVALHQLAVRSGLDLDAPVSRFLPWFKPIPSYEGGAAPAREVTIRELMTHTSGLQRDLGDTAMWSQPKDNTWPTLDAIKDAFARGEVMLTHGPGMHENEHGYANLGYAILGALIEQVSGRPYEQYVQEEILNPLDMKDTVAFGKEGTRPVTTGYMDPLDGGAPSLETRAAADAMRGAGAFLAAAGYLSNGADLAKLGAWLGAATEDDPVLPRGAIDRMMEGVVNLPSVADLGVTHTQGGLMRLVTFEGPASAVVGHTGTGRGHRSATVLDPVSGLGLTVSFNASTFGIAGVVRRASQVFAAMRPQVPPRAVPEAAPPARPEWQEIAGIYSMPPRRNISVTVDQYGHLRFEGVPLVPAKRDGERWSLRHADHQDAPYEAISPRTARVALDSEGQPVDEHVFGFGRPRRDDWIHASTPSPSSYDWDTAMRFTRQPDGSFQLIIDGTGHLGTKLVDV